MSEPVPSQHAYAAGRAGNRFDRSEWAGAFGDLGTLLRFVLAYIAVVKIEPTGLLLAFGASMIAVDLYYETPVPVQPMKAVGAVAATQAFPIGRSPRGPSASPPGS